MNVQKYINNLHHTIINKNIETIKQHFSLDILNKHPHCITKKNRMKNLCLFVLAICLTEVSYSQSEYNNYWDSDFNQINYSPIQLTPTQNVSKITFEEINLKKNKIKKHIKYYNNNGKVVNYLFVNEKNDTLVQGIQEYTATGEVKSGKMFKKKVLMAYLNKEYDSQGHITKMIKNKGDKKVIYYNTWKWDEKGNMTESILI